AAVLHTRIPWHVDGKSLVGTKLAADGTVSVLDPNGHGVQSDLRALLARRRQVLAEPLRTFGSGPLSRVYRIRPHLDLLGRSVSSLTVRPSSSKGVHVNGRELLGAVDPSLGVLPTYVTGTLTGRHPAQQELAVAVNGTVGAVTRSYSELGETKF